MEDNDFSQVRALLRSVEPPPGNIDAASVLGAARRSEKHHRLTVALTAGGLTAIVLIGAVGAVSFARNDDRAAPAAVASHSAPAPAIQLTTPPTCTLQLLPTPVAGDYADMSAADRTGRIQAGMVARGDTTVGPVIWRDGVASLVHLPSSVSDAVSNVVGVNSHGDLVLTGGKAGTDSWLYHNGRVTKLPSPPGMDTVASDINDSGDIVGWGEAPSGHSDVVVWPHDHPGTVDKLATPHGVSAMALSIDDAGTVGGSLGDGDTPYVWNANGTGHALKVPSGRHGGKVFDANGDWAVGWVGDSKKSTGLVGARWNLRTGAVDVFTDNDEGVAVAPNGDFAGGIGDAYIFRNGVFDELPGVSYYPGINPTGISPDGNNVVGTAEGPPTAKPGEDGPVIWHC
jgi:hypothetical protein